MLPEIRVWEPETTNAVVGIVKIKVERRLAVRSLCIDSFEEAASPTIYHGLVHVLSGKGKRLSSRLRRGCCLRGSLVELEGEGRVAAPPRNVMRG